MKKAFVLATIAVVIVLGLLSYSGSQDSAGNAIKNAGAEKHMSANAGDTVKVDYVGTLEDGTVFDTSVESVAKESGKFYEGRKYEPLEFKVGAGQMIKGFDGAVVDMEVGEEKTVTLSPEDAYGQRNDNLVQEVPKQTLANAGIEPQEGITIYANGHPAKITHVGNETVSVDFNHELAGKTLIFKITLREIT